MAPPLYFFPGVVKTELVKGDQLSPEVLRARGLVETFADIDSAGRDCSIEEPPGAGPGNNAGTFLTAMPASGRKHARIGPGKDRHDWTEFHHQGAAYWVGLDKLEPPTPDDLARKDQVTGYEIEIGGRAWKIPVIRNPDAGTGLRRHWEMAEDGSCREAIVEAYRKLWDDFAAVVDVFYADDPAAGQRFSMPAADALKWCLAVLSVNYRFGRAEQNTMHVVGSDNWANILALAVDVPTFYSVYLEAQEGKKKETLDPETKDASPDTEPGPPADSPGTDQAEPS